MCVSSIIYVEYVSNSSLNEILSLVHIPYFHSVTVFYISKKIESQNLQHMTVVDQEMVDINYQQIPIYMRFGN